MDDVAAAYGASADAWTHGPEQVYRRLADAMLVLAPVPVAGARVLDIGAGTGACVRAAVAAGARDVVATDLAPAMLAALGPGVPRVAARAGLLPFRDGAFDLATAACVLGHLPDPVTALREARRVAPALAATAFRSGWTHPAKAAVDEAMLDFGHSPPAWYVRMKSTTEPLVDDPENLRALAVAAGWTSPEVTVVPVPAGLHTPARIAAWRLGMAHLAPFLASLSPGTRERATRAAEAAVTGMADPVIPLVVLAAR